MAVRARFVTGILVIALLRLCVSLTGESSFSFLDPSYSPSSSASTSIVNRMPCIYRAEFLQDGERFSTDACTNCTCHNGTLTCDIQSCQSDPGCEVSERYRIEGQCCFRCPEQRTTTVTALSWELTEVERSFYGKETLIRLDVRTEFRESEKQKGVGMWRVGLFGSSNPEGGGPRFGEVYQALGKDKAATPKTRNQLDIRRIKTDFDLGSIGCGDVKYFCVEFAKGDTPDPRFTMHFHSDNNGSNSLITCKQQMCSKRNRRQKVRQCIEACNNDL